MSLDGTVYVVDDDESLRKSLQRLLTAEGYESAASGSADEFLGIREYDRPSCLVLDIQMPGVTGIDLQACLRERGESMPIVFLTGHADVPTSVQAMKEGAVDFLQKPVDAQQLFDAIEQALRLDTECRQRLQEAAAVQVRVDLLTPRELEIMSYVITGMLNKQIAYALEISEKTVKVHRGRVMEKMGVYSVAELVRLCEKVGVDPAETDEPT